MHSIIATVAAAGLVSLANAYTPPTGNPTWGPLLTPDLSDPVTQGKTTTVTWDPQNHPTDGVTVSLVLCQGPGSNCVPQSSAIASGLAASAKSYQWSVPCSLAPGTQNTDTGYGMLIIVDGTGEFQYSTQFSVLADASCGSSSSSSSSSSSASTTTSSSSGPTSTTSAVSTTAKATTTSKPGKTLPPPQYATSSWYTNGTWSHTIVPVSSGDSSSTASPVISSSGSTTWTYPAQSGVTVIGGSTMTTIVPASASVTYSATPSGPTAGASAFPGAAANVKASVAGIVIAGAVAVLAL